MTKQEYEQAMKIASEEWDIDSTDSAMVSDWTKPKDQYIFALEKRITELEKHIKNAVDDINATDYCVLITSRPIEIRKVLERIKYILTAAPKEQK